MKNIKTITEIEPKTYAIEQITDTVDTTKGLVSFKWSDTEHDFVANVQPVSFRLYNVKDGMETYVADGIAIAYYEAMIAKSESKIAKLDEKYLSDGLTGTEETTLRRERKILGYYQTIYDGIKDHTNTVEQSNFAKFIAGAISGYHTIAIPQMNGLLKVLANDGHTMQDIKDEVNKIAVLITGEETEFFNAWRMNCNGALAKDIEARYYKGRVISKKSGNVVQKYDDKGQIIRKEIILAILQFLQNKALMGRYTAPEETKPEQKESPVGIKKNDKKNDKK